MKSIETKSRRVVVIKVEKDEDLIDVIKENVLKFKLRAGLINCIGALKKTTLGYFDLESGKYNFKTFDENVELITCMGNIAYVDEDPVIHIHASVGRGDYSILGGHLGQPSIVSITGEVYIYEISERLFRSLDPQFGLSLLNL